MRTLDKSDAIRSLVGGGITTQFGGNIVYHDGQTPPSEAEIDAELIRLQAEYDALQYQRDREPDYPNLAEQFDLLWHAIDADTLDKTSDFYTTLKAVKDAHPKG
jgi:hypothetical protein